MQEEYPVYLKGSRVGTVQMSRQDLFYHIRCQCHPKKPGMYRLVAKTEKAQTDLGICVPMDGYFGVETRVSRKRFAEGKPEFQLCPTKEEIKGCFYPVDPDMPFAHLSKLKDGVFASRDGHAGVIMRNSEDNN